ncbi:ribonuclease E activity regulator RraA [Endozoicomonas ascidiicola]|uniref:ribonuclease E activity regulator RraA n=1 Tax=Endozoicomonas ascidiicola TaxID=1698521 RepID=UPI00082F25C1|nr:ribonuclease E activity regulator RraA [Endozoicomonas ascidiicola]
MSFTTPDLCDDFPGKIQVVEPGFRSYGGNQIFSGKIVTIKCHEDNSMVREQVSTDGQGKVLVIDGGGSMRRALLGDMLAEKAVSNGWQGIIVYGCIRDVEVIAKLPIGVQALASHPMKTDKKGLGEVDVSVRFHGTDFIPGQFLYADTNGVLVSSELLI